MQEAQLVVGEILVLSQGATKHELEHLARMVRGFRDSMDGNDHGGFVTYMAKKDFESAFRNADNINRRFFGALVAARLALDPP